MRWTILALWNRPLVLKYVDTALLLIFPTPLPHHRPPVIQNQPDLSFGKGKQHWLVAIGNSHTITDSCNLFSNHLPKTEARHGALNKRITFRVTTKATCSSHNFV